MNSFLKTTVIIITLSLGHSHSTHTMWKAVTAYLAPSNDATQAQVKKEINSAIEFSKTFAHHCSDAAGDKSGEINGIAWSVVSVKKESGDSLIQVTCSDPAIEKIYKDKQAQGLL